MLNLHKVRRGQVFSFTLTELILLILFILVFHIVGALKHTFVDKDGTLRRMWS